MKKSLLSTAALAALLSLSAHAHDNAHRVAHDADDAPAHIARHVLLISVDGLHQNDLAWFIKQHPNSTLARLAQTGVSYANATTPFPSDSFPGMVGQVTGGHPRTTGIYYDDAYSRALLPPGTAHCDGVAPGTEVQYAENVDKNLDRLDAGQNIAGLYDNFELIAGLSAHPAADLIDPAQLPVDPKTCAPVYPHQYLRVNTVFEVAHNRGLHTAWSDKHPAYDILNGPSGLGIDDLFTPEINGSITDPSLPAGAGPDFTKDNLDTQTYDDLKVKAVLNWLAGHDHAGNGNPGVPAIMGLNFQTVSTAQKLNLSNYVDPTNPSNTQSGGLGGYTLDASNHLVPGPVLSGALAFIDTEVGKMVNAADWRDTVIILSAKHGQSPRSRADLTIINDGTMLDALNAAWTAQSGSATPLVAHAMDDDGVLLWLNDRSEAALQFTATFLQNYSGTGIGSDAAGHKIAKPFTSAGLKQILVGREAAEFIGTTTRDARVPDVIGVAQQGSVYGGGKLSKIAEHGGNAADDRHVGLLIAGAGIRAARIDQPVETTQIAPTILKLLGLPARKLQAVRIEGTRALPGLSD